MGKKDEGAGVDISPADKEANTGKDGLPRHLRNPTLLEQDAGGRKRMNGMVRGHAGNLFKASR